MLSNILTLKNQILLKNCYLYQARKQNADARGEELKTANPFTEIEPSYCQDLLKPTEQTNAEPTTN